MVRTQSVAIGHLKWCLVACFLASRVAHGAVPEYDVKAALIYKIAKFVRWPEAAFAYSGGLLHLCVVGKDEFGASIDALKGQKIQGQLVEIERLPRAEQPLGSCHIIFVSRSERGRLQGLVGALGATAALTISDIDAFASQGGMVGFVTRDGKLSFQINPAASGRAGLEIGSQLLQLATLVSEQRESVKP